MVGDAATLGKTKATLVRCLRTCIRGSLCSSRGAQHLREIRNDILPGGVGRQTLERRII